MTVWATYNSREKTFKASRDGYYHGRSTNFRISFAVATTPATITTETTRTGAASITITT